MRIIIEGAHSQFNRKTKKITDLTKLNNKLIKPEFKLNGERKYILTELREDIYNHIRSGDLTSSVSLLNKIKNESKLLYKNPENKTGDFIQLEIKEITRLSNLLNEKIKWLMQLNVERIGSELKDSIESLQLENEELIEGLK